MADLEGVKKQVEYNLEIEEPGSGVESFYFWILRFLSERSPSGLGFKEIKKIKDIYSASETSAYFGNVEQRKGLQQDKVTQYLGLLGQMSKSLFQIIRELRILEERRGYYEDSKKEGQTADNAELALKSIWVDLVEGGAKNPASVIGLASNVGFVILPDLFFKIHPKKREQIPSYVDALKDDGINAKVREVLTRKLEQYMRWKETTDKELEQRWNFILKYLRQQYNSMKLYISWVRPYLRNLKKLQMNQEERPEIVTAFETTVIELELLAKMQSDNEHPDRPFPCIRVCFEYIAIPQMAYQKDYQRGAIHTGMSKIKIQGYAMSDNDVKKYMEKQDQEDLDLLASVNSSMDALKDDLKKFLKLAGEKFPEDEEKKEEEKIGMLKALFTPFTSIFKGFKEMFGKSEKGKEEKKKTMSSWEMEQSSKNAGEKSTSLSFVLYNVFKKSHQMLAW